ncbi:L-fucose dehydrogenase [Anseongella ginsenosidimutans]|uniref:L-fucose dehydrogenase n=1 Tax=Anseongella ginsenosidimutans TaxID=496056 RepID=A0A4R3KSD1_9SPHI|nr:SDR family oxidoreductase [Anseongella ginsenosidimutans]QEC53061.1 SDR family oxidoreductase [Anseongella ginsenosidimutans]TCS87676.1 L-fucose dehydrogenase [Anseongella ginsenosidimutans]
MDLNLENKIIIVTGGAKGVGKGISRVLAQEGAVPVIAGRNEQDNMQAVAEIEREGRIAFAVTAELTRPGDSENAVKLILDKFGRIDGLVNNAGVNDGVGLENGSYEDFLASLHRNLIHYYLMAHYALPALRESKGAIVNISSRTAETGQGSTSAYAASNGGRNALTREWAVELLKYGIRVNAVIVGDCWTPLYEKWVSTFPDPEAKLTSIRSTIPLGKRMTTAEELGNAVAFLLSDRSSHTTGQLFHVDGGFVHLDRTIH